MSSEFSLGEMNSSLCGLSQRLCFTSLTSPELSLSSHTVFTSVMSKNVITSHLQCYILAYVSQYNVFCFHSRLILLTHVRFVIKYAASFLRTAASCCENAAGFAIHDSLSKWKDFAHGIE